MTLFVGNNVAMIDTLQEVLQLMQKRRDLDSPVAKTSVHDLAKLIEKTREIPQGKEDLFTILHTKFASLLPHFIDVQHPFCAAHLHCRPLMTGVLAEFIIAVCNLSMDSWDQSGIATAIEQQVIAWINTLLDYSNDSDGVFTSGGTQSNMMGVLLAREHFAKNKKIKPFTQTGMNQQLIILCTEHAHFSIIQAARWLGIGSDQVIVLNMENTQEQIQQLIKNNKQPFVVMATAGCTDFGNIDPLSDIRQICNKYQLWMHVDAAVGGALLLTQYKGRLSGIEQADSVTIDFHKLFFQPISASAFLVKHKISFEVMNFYSDYLNRKEDETAGMVNLVGKSLQTTRRFDALKIWLTWQHLGIIQMGEIIEKLLSLTQQVSATIKQYHELELAALPSINTLVFRYIHDLHSDEINSLIRSGLFNQGLAIIGETRYRGKIYLKLTLMNPEVTIDEMECLIALIIQRGQALC